MASIWDRLQLARQDGPYIGRGRWRAVRFDQRAQDELARRRMLRADEQYRREMDEALGEGFVRREVQALAEGRLPVHPAFGAERRR